tara:strand:- start:14907 stop:15722 length:816 start_codon:yes stop_codon:yes gene_type:complete
MAFDARIPYALVDAEGRIQSQNYALENELGAVEVAPGLYLHRAELPDGRPSILNPDRSYISEPGSPEAVWLQYARAALAFPAQVMTDDAGVVTMAAPAGTRVTTQDGVKHEEAGGEIAITFPQGGRQIVQIDQPGCSPSSVLVIVRFLPETKDALKAEIDAERGRCLIAPLASGGITLNGDEASQSNIEAAAIQGFVVDLQGGAGTYSMQWIAYDNSVVTLNAAELRAFTDVIAARRSFEYARARAAKDAVLAAPDVATAQAARDAYLAGA